MNIMGVLQCVIFILVFGQIVLRRLGVIVPWASEIAQYSNVIIVFCGLPAVTYRQSHIVMDTLSGRIPEKYKRYYHAAASASLLVFYIMAARGFIVFMPAAKTVSLVSLLWFPMNIIYAACLGGLFVAMLSSLINIIIYLFGTPEQIQFYEKEAAQ